jgi:hypothetical protein
LAPSLLACCPRASEGRAALQAWATDFGGSVRDEAKAFDPAVRDYVVVLTNTTQVIQFTILATRRSVGKVLPTRVL